MENSSKSQSVALKLHIAQDTLFSLIRLYFFAVHQIILRFSTIDIVNACLPLSGVFEFLKTGYISVCYCVFPWSWNMRAVLPLT